MTQSPPRSPQDDACCGPLGYEASTDTLPEIVDLLCAHCHDEERNGLVAPRNHPMPSRDAIIETVEALRGVLFPGYFGLSEINIDNMRFHVGSTLDHLLRGFSEQVRRGLCFRCTQQEPGVHCADCQQQALEITRRFLSFLPGIQRVLAQDVRAAFDGDPAAKSMDEIIFCYPGILAITNYRIAHALYRLDVPVIPRIITEHAHSITGIDIHPGATIGPGLFIDHGTGVVIGETCEFGRNVKLYQGVTLGARSFPKDESGRPVKGIPRHPILEDNVTIYSNATVLGRVRIGAGSVIGGNVWLTHSVPPGSRVTQATAREDFYVDGGGI